VPGFTPTKKVDREVVLLVRLVRESSVQASSAQWFIAALRVAHFSLEE
jgi:hypothetical protein